jgi:hypothetical protein
VVGNPDELVWGKPYRFVEVKGRAEMSLTGNLKSRPSWVISFRTLFVMVGREYSGIPEPDNDREASLHTYRAPPGRPIWGGGEQTH